MKRRLADTLRFPARTSAFAGMTVGMYGMLELETALRAPGERSAVLEKWIGRYGRALLRLYGVRVRAVGPFVGEGRRYPGRDAGGVGRLFVMNHRSGLDIPITIAHLEATLVSRHDIAGWPIIGMAARRAGTVFVDRESRRSGAAALVAMSDAIRAGRGVMVYPEGTTFEGDEVRAFHTGAFMTAQRTGAEVVPVGLAYEGGGAAFGDESFPRHMMRVSMTKATRAALVVGEPFAGPHDDARRLVRDAREAVQALVHRARTLLP